MPFIKGRVQAGQVELLGLFVDLHDGQHGCLILRSGWGPGLGFASGQDLAIGQGTAGPCIGYWLIAACIHMWHMQSTGTQISMSCCSLCSSGMTWIKGTIPNPVRISSPGQHWGM